MVIVNEIIGSAENILTTNVMSVGDSFLGELEAGSDQDWIAINLVQGYSYEFQQKSFAWGIDTLPLDDPYLYFYDENGVLIGQNDDSGVYLNSLLAFTATTTGTYYLVASDFSGFLPGTYEVTAVVTNVPDPTQGDDDLIGGDAPTTLNLLAGNDTWTGVSSTDNFVVGMYTDTINGGAGDDSIYGGLGNDRITGGTDNDLIDAGDGNDNAWGGAGFDTLFGGSGTDRLNGNSGEDEIYGGSGNDFISGGTENDYLYGGGQADRIFGGDGNDEMYGGDGSDILRGGADEDVVYGGSGNDNINGDSGNDEIFGGHGRDVINGGAGFDIIFGGVSNDRLNGNSGNDIILGDRGNDILNGGTGDDELYGGGQGDRLNGGDGNDILSGGRGNDRLIGGADADTFVFEGTVNDDVIVDFELGVDQIDFSAYGPISDADAMAIASQSGANVVLDLGGSGQVTLLNINLGDLSLEDFIYVSDDIFELG